MDATIKHLLQSNHVLLVSFGRYLFGAFFSGLIWWRAGKPVITKEMWVRTDCAALLSPSAP